MRRLREEGVEWIVIDPQHWHYLVPGAPRSPHFEWMEVLRCHLAERFEPAAVFSHLSNARREFLSEAWGLEFLDEMQAADAGMILAYRLDASHAR